MFNRNDEIYERRAERFFCHGCNEKEKREMGHKSVRALEFGNVWLRHSVDLALKFLLERQSGVEK